MYQSEFCDVSHDKTLNIAFVKWKQFCRGDGYRNPLRHALEIMGNNDGCHYCADTRMGFENESADTQWVFDTFLPQAAKTTCRKVFFVIDADNSLKDELEGQSAELSKLFDVHYCFGLDEVRQILGK